MKELFLKIKNIEMPKYKKVIYAILFFLLSIIIVVDITLNLLFVKNKRNAYVKGDTVTFGRYVTDEALGEYDTPIPWEVLRVDGDKLLLISSKVIECKKYNDIYEDCNWETCTLRKWLNEDFFTEAFDFNEQSKILDSILISGKDKIKTVDKIYIPSEDEVKYYYERNDENNHTKFSSELLTNASMQALPTIHAINEGVTIRNISLQLAAYWLRDEGKTNKKARYVSFMQETNIDSVGHNVDFPYIGVRPVIEVQNNKYIELVENDY